MSNYRQVRRRILGAQVKKRVQPKSKPSVPSILAIGLIVVFIAIFVAAFLLNRPAQTNASTQQTGTQQEANPGETGEERQKRYDYVLAHVASTNVHPLLRAVHVSVGMKMVSSGTLLLNKEGAPKGIITSSLAFFNARNPEDTYDYHVLGGNPLGMGSYITKGHISSLDLRTYDGFAYLHLGDSSPISLPERASVVVQAEMVSDKVRHVEPFTVRSVATGEQYQVVGEIAGTKPQYIMLYKAIGIEGGSGYVDPSGNLLVLTAATTLTDVTRKELDVDSSHTRVSVLSPVPQEMWNQ